MVVILGTLAWLDGPLLLSVASKVRLAGYKLCDEWKFSYSLGFHDRLYYVFALPRDSFGKLITLSEVCENVVLLNHGQSFGVTFTILYNVQYHGTGQSCVKTSLYRVIHMVPDHQNESASSDLKVNLKLERCHFDHAYAIAELGLNRTLPPRSEATSKIQVTDGPIGIADRVHNELSRLNTSSHVKVRYVWLTATLLQVFRCDDMIIDDDSPIGEMTNCATSYRQGDGAHMSVFTQLIDAPRCSPRIIMAPHKGPDSLTTAYELRLGPVDGNRSRVVEFENTKVPTNLFKPKYRPRIKSQSEEAFLERTVDISVHSVVGSSTSNRGQFTVVEKHQRVTQQAMSRPDHPRHEDVVLNGSPAGKIVD